MKRFFYKMFFALFISHGLLAMEVNEHSMLKSDAFFYELSDELIVEILWHLSSSGSDPKNSLFLLAQSRLIDKRFNILVQEFSIIKKLIKYWSKKLRLPKVYLIWDWLNIKSKRKEPWFYKFLLRILDELDTQYLDQTDPNGKNLLILALEKNNLDVINILLTKDINFKAQDAQGRDVLMLSLLNSKEEIVEQIIQKEIDISIKDKNGKTALDYASDRNNGKLYNLLMKKGADDSNVNYGDICNPSIVLRYGSCNARFEYVFIYAIMLSTYCGVSIIFTVVVILILVT